MRALYFESHGEVSRLVVGERPRPRPGEGEVLVSLRAAALNHLDLFVLRGLPAIPVELPHIGGADGAGTVAELGEGVAGWRIGDEVVLNPTALEHFAHGQEVVVREVEGAFIPGSPVAVRDRGGELVGVGVALAYLARARTVNVAPRMVLAELETAIKA